MFFSIHEKIAFTFREIKSARRQHCVVCKENNVTDSTLGNGVCKFCGDIFILVGLFLSHGGKLETCTQLSNPTEMPPGKWMKPFCQYGIDCLPCVFSRGLCSGLNIEKVVNDNEMDKALESTFNNNKVIFRAEYIDGTIGLRPQNTVLHGAAIENQAQDTPGPFVLQANIHVSKEQNIAKDSTKLIRIQKAISVEDTDVRVVDFSKDQMISQHVTEQGTMQTMNTLRDDVKLDEEAKEIQNRKANEEAFVENKLGKKYNLGPLVTDSMIFEYATLEGPYPDIFLTTFTK